MRKLLAAALLCLPLLLSAQEEEEAPADAPSAVDADKATPQSGQGLTNAAPAKKAQERGGGSQTAGGGSGGSGGGAAADEGAGVFGKGTCPGHSRTFWIELDPKAVGLVFDTAWHGGIGKDGAVVVKLVTPAKEAADVAQNLGVVEYPGNADMTTKHVAVSNKPCDFEGASAPAGLKTAGIETSLTWIYGPAVKTRYPRLAPNRTYYINVTNVGCSPSSKDRTCDIRVETGLPAAVREALGWPAPEEPLHFQK